MPRGRPFNQQRAAAKEAGERFYEDPHPCDMCGNTKRYTSNAGCVACMVARGKARYAALDSERLAALKAADHDRYVKRMAKAESPS